MLVSVVIPTFKRTDKLERALESVLNQTYKLIELIVVDDNEPGSKDRRETESLLGKYTGKEQIIYIRHSKNRGASEARNTGIKNARGNWVAFLDDDDEWFENKLEKQVKALIEQEQRKKNIGVVYCREKFIEGNLIYYRNSGIVGDPLHVQIIKSVATTSSLLIKKNVLAEVGGFKKLSGNQEGELLLRIFSRGYQTVFVDEILCIRHIHSGERITDKRLSSGLNWFEVRKKYLDQLPRKKQGTFFMHYHLKKFRILLMQQKKKEAFKQWFLAWKRKPYAFICYIEFLAFFTSSNRMMRIKSFLHESKEKLINNNFFFNK